MKANILVADHDSGLTEAIRCCLVARGYEVETATSGLQCQELLRTYSPSVLVLDSRILWHGGDGILQWLIQEEPVVSPMVVVSAGSRIPDQLESWIDARIEWPKSPSDLVGFVSQLETLAWWSQSPGRDSRKPRPGVGRTEAV